MLTDREIAKKFKDLAAAALSKTVTKEVDGYEGAPLTFVKIKPCDIELAERGCIKKNEDGKDYSSSSLYNALIIISGIKEFSMLDIEWLCDKSSAGLTQKLKEEIMEFSDFGVDTYEIVEKKKS